MGVLMDFVRCLLCWSIISSARGMVLDSQSPDPEILQVILRLQADVTSLKEDVRILKTKLNSSDIATSPVPAFLATLDNSISNCNKRPVIFENVRLNEGSCYDVRHGLFRAPRNGTYHFAVTFSDPPSTTYHVFLVKNSPANVIGYLHLASTNMWTERSTNVLVKLVQGDDVWLECNDNSNSYILGSSFHSHFSGFYVGP